jgi:hypothetical protein
MIQRTEATRITIVVALGALLVVGCAAQEANSSQTPEEAARALAELSVELGSLEQALDRATTSAWEATEPPLTLQLGRELNDDESEWVSAMLRATLAEYMTGDIWQDAVTRVYGQHFSAVEIEQLIEFYGSPLGRKMLSHGDELAQQIDDDMRERLDAKIEEFIGQVDTKLAEKFEELGGGS